jgi:hypothetical protein
VTTNSRFEQLQAAIVTKVSEIKKNFAGILAKIFFEAMWHQLMQN